ncbi:MAG: alpha/beta hydrolase, partial [Pseudomonadota bacterium]
YFDRLQAAINTNEELKAQLPDIKALMRRVHTKLDEAPMMLAVPQQSGEPVQFLLERRDLQQLTSGMISDPQSAIMAMQMYLLLDAGDTGTVSQIASRFVDPGAPISYRPMSFAMDLASGTGKARMAQVAKDAETSLLKDYLNFPMPHLDGYVDGLDLGDNFREAPVSDIPMLVLSGTLDGRTYPESQAEAVAGFSDTTIVTIENAGHNLFMVSPDVTETIQAFMRGQPVTKTRITVELPTP